MMKNELETLRDEINYLMGLDEYDKDELVRKSQELDKLILESVKKYIFTSTIFEEGHVPEFDEVINKVRGFESKIDKCRIVNPVNNQVFDVVDGDYGLADYLGDSFWDRQKVCNKCISIRAYEENNVQYKLVYTRDSAYMVIAIPFHIKGKKLVLEVLKIIK